ncbi:hypothetical protein K2X05_10860 [bacterium]|nr:hypothetical protein [bacterium]
MGFLQKINKFLSAMLFLVFLASCSSDTSEFYYANLDVGNPKIIIASNVAGEYALTMYDTPGNLLRVLADYNPANIAPRGLMALNEFEFLVAYDGTNVDGIHRFSLLDGEGTFVTDTNLNGNIFQMRRHDSYGTFVIETNVIEAFDELGQRVGAPRIATTIGACTLNTSRGMTFNSSGYLVVVGNGNDDILVYDVSDPTNTVCVRANTSFAGTVDPVAVLAHSDGFLYVATQGDDRIYRFSGDGSGVGTIVFSNVSFIDNPTALVEMPDGSLLVASDGTNTLVNITTSGFLIGANYLVSDVYTNSISDMIILQEDP